MSSETRFVRLRRQSGDVFVADVFDACDDASIVDAGVQRFFSTRCDISESSVEIAGVVHRVEIYRDRADEQDGYLLVSPTAEASDENLVDQRFHHWLDYANECMARVGWFEGLAGEQLREISMHFVRPNLVLEDETTPRTVAWEELSEARRVLLHGAPGAGKTSLLRRLAHEFATQLLEDPQSASVPVYIQLRGIGRPEFGIGELERAIESELALEDSSGLAELADAGRLVVILDGLDEVLDTARKGVARDIERLASEFPSLRLFVSTRTGSAMPEVDGQARLRLESFGREQVKEWLWLTSPSSRLQNGFLSHLSQNEQLVDVVRNPLMLSITASYFRRGTLVPSQRGSIAEHLSRALIDEWDRDRGVARSSQWINELDTVTQLCQLSTWMTVTETHDASTSEVVSAIGAGSQRDGAEMVQTLAERTGLIEQTGDRRWRFAHDFFRDYFAARYLTSAGTSTEGGNVIRRPGNESVWLHACGLSFDSGSLIAEMIDPAEGLDLFRANLVSTALLGSPNHGSRYLVTAVSALVDFIEARLNLPPFEDANDATGLSEYRRTASPMRSRHDLVFVVEEGGQAPPIISRIIESMALSSGALRNAMSSRLDSSSSEAVRVLALTLQGSDDLFARPVGPNGIRVTSIEPPREAKSEDQLASARGPESAVIAEFD